MSHIKRYFKIQIVTFYVLINSAFVGKNSFVLIKMHGKTTIKINLLVSYGHELISVLEYSRLKQFSSIINY